VELKNPLEGVPKQITSAIGDIGRIADKMQALPELVKILSTIEARVESLDDEVKKMRAEVSSLKEQTEDLPSKLDEVGSALHPLRRLSRRGRGNGEIEEDDA
jgi:predicted nuclease with TOPRIM domain